MEKALAEQLQEIKTGLRALKVELLDRRVVDRPQFPRPPHIRRSACACCRTPRSKLMTMSTQGSLFMQIRGYLAHYSVVMTFTIFISIHKDIPQYFPTIRQVSKPWRASASRFVQESRLRAASREGAGAFKRLWP